MTDIKKVLFFLIDHSKDQSINDRHDGYREDHTDKTLHITAYDNRYHDGYQEIISIGRTTCGHDKIFVKSDSKYPVIQGYEHDYHDDRQYKTQYYLL